MSPLLGLHIVGHERPISSLAADLSQLIAITRVLSATPGWKGRQRPIDSGVISSVLAKSLGNLQHQTPSQIGTGFAIPFEDLDERVSACTSCLVGEWEQHGLAS